MKTAGVTLAAAICLAVACGASADGAKDAMHGPGEMVTQISAHTLPNVPGKSFIVVEVSYAPGGRSLPHHHAKSAFIYAYVVSGAIRSQVAGEPVHVFRAGQGFYEMPGAHHLIGENASKTEPAKLLAVLIVDTNDKVLTIPDE